MKNTCVVPSVCLDIGPCPSILLGRIGWLCLLVVSSWCLPGIAVAADLDREILLREVALARSGNQGSRLPEVRWAGYRYGKAPLQPLGGLQEFPVDRFGAVPNDHGDDRLSIQTAIRHAELRGGIVRFGVGRYRLDGHLVIGSPKVFLVGAGSSASILSFSRSLHETTGVPQGQLDRTLSWSGGLIWFARGQSTPVDRPRALLPRESELGSSLPLPVQDTYQSSTTSMPRGLAQGTNVIGSIDPSVRYPEVIPVEVHWIGGKALAAEIFGCPVGAAAYAPWASAGTQTNSDPTLIYVTIPNVLRRNERGILTLDKPLRLSTNAAHHVVLSVQPAPLVEVGVSGLSLEMPDLPATPHNQNRGFNGIAMESFGHGYINDVSMLHAENGVILENCWNITIRGLVLSGRKHHHGSSFSGSHDCLMEDFDFRAESIHGISTQDRSSGNVWRRGRMNGGTFDSHTGTPFDSLRTDILLVNPVGSPGGNPGASTFNGRRMIHWGITVETDKLTDKQRRRAPEWIRAPIYHPRGILAGISGVDVFGPAKAPWAMPITISQEAMPLLAASVPFPDCYAALTTNHDKP